MLRILARRAGQTCARPGLGDGAVMADRRDGPRRPPRAPLRSRGRRRWVVLIGVAVMWLLFLRGTASVTLATAMLLLLWIAIGLGLLALPGLGVDPDHPCGQRVSEPPQRAGGSER